MHRLPVRIISARFDIPKTCVFRHRRLHMPPQLIAAIATAAHPTEIDVELLQKSESEGLLAGLIAQRARLALISEMAFSAGEISAAVSAERAVTGSLELTSRLLGMIVQRHDVRSTSLLISPDYIQLRSAIVSALRPFPEAARAVGVALAKLETEAAAEIKESKKPLLLEAGANG